MTRGTVPLFQCCEEAGGFRSTGRFFHPASPAHFYSSVPTAEQWTAAAPASSTQQLQCVREVWCPLQCFENSLWTSEELLVACLCWIEVQWHFSWSSVSVLQDNNCCGNFMWEFPIFVFQICLQKLLFSLLCYLSASTMCSCAQNTNSFLTWASHVPGF